MRSVKLPDGQSVAALGQGTWRMGEDPGNAAAETEALRAGIELGLTLIDTAEMYGEGATERFLGSALTGLRQTVFLVSKAYPTHAGRSSLPRACEASLKRLKTDYLDLYLLHWRGTVPLAETIDAMRALQHAGKIRYWGVSNFDQSDMVEMVEHKGEDCATNQILYNIGRRDPEFDLMAWMTKRAMPVMAYSPLEQGRLAHHPVLGAVGRRHDVDALVVALAWVLQRPSVIAIPKTGTLAHLRQNHQALDLALTDLDKTELEAAFPPPVRKRPLAML